ncbi:MAG TPA: hypothetical protein QGG18_10070, partial [Rhodospirillales bacterium]|nr:hypothetical protein [Rhodospirillales bacterium]
RLPKIVKGRAAGGNFTGILQEFFCDNRALGCAGLFGCLARGFPGLWRDGLRLHNRRFLEAVDRFIADGFIDASIQLPAQDFRRGQVLNHGG